VSEFETLYQNVMDAVPADTFVNEANAKPKRIPTGTYKLVVSHKELKAADDFFANGNPNPNAGRLLVRTQMKAEKDGGVLGVVFPDLSPVEVRTVKNRLDAPSQLWGHVIKALDLQGKTNNEIFAALDMYPLKGRVSLTYRSPDGAYTECKDGVTQDEVEHELARAGLDPSAYTFTNQVRSLGRWDG
jgi:hypothetical protein